MNDLPDKTEKDYSEEPERQEDTTEDLPGQDWNNRHNEREAEREEIRQRVRNSTAQNEYFRPALPTPTIQDESDKVVAVYARVSTLDTAQTSSIENQTLYYTKKIAENPHWTMQEIYSDEGKSGTSLRHRDAFNRMMENAKLQKMDLILCASVSRFARNMSDCMEQLSRLKTMHPSKPIGVFFETENIYSLDPNSEQALTIHAMLADWESANKSRRMILSYDQRILTGQYPVADLLGYRHTKNGDLVIQPEEAKTVRFMFVAFIGGYSYEEIAQKLTEKQRPTLKGRVEWNEGMVRNIMSNERTWGDLEARKTIVVDYKKGIVIRNRGQRDSAYVPGHHEGLVSPEIARAARMLAASGHRAIGGVPDLYVIPEGSLKGFVSFHPRWQGINAEVFQDLCNGIYSEDEKEQLGKESALISGERHSNILSMQFTGYQVPPGIFFLNRNMPQITLTRTGIRIGSACHTALHNTTYVSMLYHPYYQTLILRESSEETPNSIRFTRKDGKGISYLPAKGFAQAVYEQLRWNPEYSFRFRGIRHIRGNTSFLVFSFAEPQILPGKNMQAATTNHHEAVKYISYQVGDEADKNASSTAYGYPKEWSDHKIGLPYSGKIIRDLAISSITEDDLRDPGVVVINPLIGNLPSQDEIQDEIETLLMSM